MSSLIHRAAAGKFPSGILACSLVFSGAPHALSTDREQSVQVLADWVEMDETRRTTTCKGGVVITQGSLRINGDTATVYYNKNRKPIKVEIKGRPAQFRQRPDGGEKEQRAKADRMEYFADRDLIVLLGNAHSWQGEQQISADRIEFDTKKSRVKAHNIPKAGKSETPKKSRVRIILPPGK